MSVNEARSEADRTAGAARRRAGIAPALLSLVERTMLGMGYELVDLERAGGGLLRVTIDREPTGAPDAARGIGIDDCERVSRHLTHLFAVEGVEYERLEVSSPGLDRPLRGARDFARFAGSLVRVQLVEPLAGRRKLRGRLLGIAGDAGAERVRMQLLADEAPRAGPAKRKGAGARAAGDGAPVEFALAGVDKARLEPEWDFRPGRR